ncbi:polynucleotide adenylyltransferase [Halomonadaceae bacterium KBTZ08]
MQQYLVGGVVRDELLGIPVKDRDWVVVGATPQEMLDAGYKQVGADFPVFLHPETNEEYALARTERKQGHGYHGFTVHADPDVTLEEDLQRRDLTINAMARSVDGEVVDPFGGRADLEARLLRHVSSAFTEDPLRILRTARFAARFAPLGFRVADDTMTLMQQMVADGEADHLVAERVWQETRRALHEQAPAVYFEVLDACGALAVVMPEIAALFARDGRAPLEHLEAAVERSDDTGVRFAALVAGLEPEEREALNNRLKVPNDCKELVVASGTLFEGVASESHPSAEQVQALIDQGDGWRRPQRFERILLVLESAGIPPEWTTMLAQAREKASRVDPRALMAEGYKGKALGEAIQRERLRCVRDVVG